MAEEAGGIRGPAKEVYGREDHPGLLKQNAKHCYQDRVAEVILVAHIDPLEAEVAQNDHLDDSEVAEAG